AIKHGFYCLMTDADARGPRIIRKSLEPTQEFAVADAASSRSTRQSVSLSAVDVSEGRAFGGIGS
ncbi:MAG TPA: hypothetical protein VGB07_09750, partial [Blastocatellia bacterium]